MNTSSIIPIDQAADGRWDAVVIGAGPAGTLAAQLLAQRGLSTLLIERQTWPRRKACGGCLNGRSLALLKALQLDGVLAKSHGVPLSNLVLHANRKQVDIELSAGAAIDRLAFDAALVEAAVASGAAFLPATSAAVEPATETAEVRRVRIASQNGADRVVETHVVLVADGLGHPSLKHIPGFDSHIEPAARVGLSLTIDDVSASYHPGKIYMAVSPAGYVGVVRTAAGGGNLAAAIDPAALRRHGAAGVVGCVMQVAGLPAIAFSDDDTWRGTPLLTRRSSRFSA